MSFNPTEEQRKAIECTSSCVVSAGAGSGKTAVLSQRFLRLVKDKKAHCDQILTLTFTNKAASEMRSRIYSLLVAEGDMEELERFSDAFISTVDSFCMRICRTGASRFGLASDFAISDQDDFMESLRGRTYAFLLDHVSSPVLMRLLSKKSTDVIVEFLLRTACVKTNLCLEFDPVSESNNYIETKNSLIEKLKADLDDACRQYTLGLEDDDRLVSDVNMLKRFLSGEISRREIAFSKARGKKENAGFAKQLKEKILGCISTLENLEIDDNDFVRSFYDLFAEYIKIVNDYKRSTASVLFSDVMAMTLSILTERQSVRDYWKSRFNYVMIDEFQDNNDDYRKLVLLLSQRKDIDDNKVPSLEETESGKIFLVGDQKQSIYRFRNADVRVFKSLSEQIEEAGGSLLKLNTNFRSSRKIMKFCNNLFRCVMGENVKNYEAGFESLDSPEGKEFDSRIIFNCYDKSLKDDKSTDANLSEAFSLSDLIETMLVTDDFLLPSGRRPTPGDIAILLRSTSCQGSIERALKSRRIPYELSESRSVTLEALANDFYHALNLCVFPDDEISRSAFESGPLSRLDLSGLMEVVKTGSSASSVSHIWHEMGYCHLVLQSPVNHSYEEHYDTLFALATAFDREGKSVIDLLDYLRPLLGQEKKLKRLEVLTETKDAVHVMTIHASKGLQFPIVIIAAMGTQPKARERFDAVSEDGHIYLPASINPKGNFDSIRDIEDGDLESRMEEAELKRLFYVAVTRAESHLVLSGSPENKTLMKFFLQYCPMGKDEQTGSPSGFESESPDDIEVRYYTSIPLEDTYIRHERDIDIHRTMDLWYENAVEDEFDTSSHHVGVTSLEGGYDLGKPRVLKSLQSDEIIRAKGLETVFGSFVHALLENAVKGLDEEPVLESGLLSEDEKEILVRDALSLRDGFLSSDVWKEISCWELHSERAFSFYDDEDDVFVDGVIDLYAVDGDRIRLIDFKTDSVASDQSHRKQMELYSEALKSIYDVESENITSNVVYLRDYL